MPLEEYIRGDALGYGAYGSVFRARGPAGEVAIKLLSIPSQARRLRFERELDMMLRLGREPGFVPVIEGGVKGQQAYLVMPLLSGGTLRERLNTQRFSPEEACVLVARLADAMGTAHAEGVVHRDLKPENILFDSDGRAFVADMGLARWVEGLGEESLGLSKSGQMRGTVGYMPPEQLRSAKSVTPAADVFALGAILHECLSGAPAFQGDTALAVVGLIQSGEFARLDARALGLSPALVRIVEGCLDPEAARRFPDGAALARALRERTLHAAPARSSGRALLLAALLALLGAGAAGALWVRRGAGSRGPDLSDGGDGLSAEAQAALRGMKSLRWVAVWGSEVGQLGGNVGVRVLDDGFLSSEPVHDRGETYLTRWAPNGRREAKRRKVPLRRLDDVDGVGRVLRGYTPGLVSVFEGPDGDWPRLLPGTEADLGDARVFDGTAHWLGHQPGPETDVGARLWVQAEGAPPRASPFPDGVWRNGEVLFLGGPGRAVFVAAKGEGAEPERQLIAWELTDRGRELWRVGGLLHQDQVRCSPDGAYVIALDQDRRRLTCYDGETGRALWSRASSFPSPDLAVIGDGRCAYLSQVTEVTVLALADGELEARWPTRDAPTRLYSVPGTSHLIANAYWRGVLERRDWRTGESAWPLAEQRGEVFALAAGAAGEVYAADGEGIVRWRAGAPERVAAWGLDPDNSASAVRVALGTRWAAALVGRSGSWKTWAFPLTGERAPFSLAELSRGERFEALAVVDDTLLAGSQDELVGFDLARQRVLWRQELANARSACAFPERGPAGALSFLCLWYNGAVFRVDALGGVEALGQLPGRPERAALSGGRLAVALDEGGVWVGEPPTYDRWGDLEEPAALAWHRGRLLGLGARGLTVWEDGFVREALDLEAVNERGTSLLVGPDDRVFVGTAYGSVLVFEPR